MAEELLCVARPRMGITYYNINGKPAAAIDIEEEGGLLNSGK